MDEFLRYTVRRCSIIGRIGNSRSYCLLLVTLTFFLTACGHGVDKVYTVDTKDARIQKINEWVKAGHYRNGHKIVRTDELDDGTIVDWVDRTTVKGAEVEAPPSPFDVKQSEDLPPSDKDVAKASLQIAKLTGPQGALPFIRPRFELFLKGTNPKDTVEAYVRDLRKKRVASLKRRWGEAGNPTAGSGDRLYGGVSVSTRNFGVMGYVNNLWPGTDNPSSPDFSFVEIASYCSIPAGGFELVGGIIGYDPAVYGSNFVFGVEYLNASGGNWITGGGNDGAWHQVSSSMAPGIRVVGASQVGGGQRESQIAVQKHGSRWWVWLINGWLGYVESSEASFSQLNSSACIGAWYGEAFDPDHETTPWMKTDMGSGSLPASNNFWDNYQTVAWVRMATYYTVINGGSATLINGWNLWQPDASCYNRQITTGPNWAYNKTFFLGGPGGDGTGCN